MTDGQLLERFATSQDEEAFEALVRRHGPMVLGLCRQMTGDEHAAEDAFQATFLVLVRNVATIRKHESLGSWLYGVARRVSSKARSGARRWVLAGHVAEMTADETEVQAGLDREEARPILRDEVGRLPEKYRAPIVLCYFEGRSHEEAAAQLAWPVGTVKGRLARARDILQARLTRRGVALSAGLMLLLESRTARASLPEGLVQSTLIAAARAVRLPGPRVTPARLLLVLAVVLAARSLPLLGNVPLAGARPRGAAEATISPAAEVPAARGPAAIPAGVVDPGPAGDGPATACKRPPGQEDRD